MKELKLNLLVLGTFLVAVRVAPYLIKLSGSSTESGSSST